MSSRHRCHVYCAGAYSAPTAAERDANVFAGQVVAHQVLSMGGIAVDPRSQYHALHGALPESVFLEAGLALLERTDAIVVNGEWRKSKGTLGELARAKECGIPMFDWNVPGDREALRVFIEDYHGGGY